jgi:hypothetical protein
LPLAFIILSRSRRLRSTEHEKPDRAAHRSNHRTGTLDVTGPKRASPVG